MKTKLRKGDQVQVVTGKYKGKRGRILQINRFANRVIVESLNIVVKTQRPKNQNDKGGIIEIEAPIAASNVQALCKKCGITRLGWNIASGKKVRSCKKCGEVL